MTTQLTTYTTDYGAGAGTRVHTVPTSYLRTQTRRHAEPGNRSLASTFAQPALEESRGVGAGLLGFWDGEVSTISGTDWE